MESLEQAVSSFLHLCFVTNMIYPVGSGMLGMAWHGTSIAPVLLVKKKDKAAKEDKTAKSFKKMFDEFRQKMYDILSRYLASKCL